MSSGIQLIVGLANPGNEYANTRHNAGAWFVEEIIRSLRLTMRPEAKFHGLYTTTTYEQQPLQLLIPTTFMNRSGTSVRACMDYKKTTPDALLVVHDELDLPVGTIKLKYDGGDGGHNGLKNIITHLHTKQFYRLRIGIGRPKENGADYVLEAPSKSDRKLIDSAIEQALSILPLLVEGQISKAMQALHTAPGE